MTSGDTDGQRRPWTVTPSPQSARDLRAFLEKLELDDVVLVGWSMGALVAWDYLEQFGTDRVAALAPNVRTEYFEASGHCPTVEQPERFNRTLAEFVEAV